MTDQITTPTEGEDAHWEREFRSHNLIGNWTEKTYGTVSVYRRQIDPYEWVTHDGQSGMESTLKAAKRAVELAVGRAISD